MPIAPASALATPAWLQRLKHEPMQQHQLCQKHGLKNSSSTRPRPDWQNAPQRPPKPRKHDFHSWPNIGLQKSATRHPDVIIRHMHITCRQIIWQPSTLTRLTGCTSCMLECSIIITYKNNKQSFNYVYAQNLCNFACKFFLKH